MDVYKSLGKAYPGGNPVNVAVYLARMKVEASYIGVVGNDEYGPMMLEAIEARGVDISRLHVSEGRTAVTEVELTSNDRVLGDYDEGVLADFSLDEQDMAFIAGHQLVHSGIWGKVEGCFKSFKEAGLITSFDFADKLESQIIESTIPYVDYAFFSYTEDNAFIEEYIKRLQSKGPKVVIATLGDKGSIAYDGISFHRAGIVPVKVVDTMGAGDSYIAGYISGILNGSSIDECMLLGAGQAAETITYFGAW